VSASLFIRTCRALPIGFKKRRMLLCPDDVAPCRRKGCGEGHCRRTGEVPLTSCLECGVVVSRHRVVAVCEECIRRYTPALEKGS